MKLEHNSTKPIIYVRPLKGWISIDFREIWEYRELLYFLIWREIKVRYKQTFVGFAWAVIQPFCMMIIFSLFFGNLMKVPSEGIPYPLFSYTALLPWMLFANGISRSSSSLIQESRLVQKIYFPRLILPISSILSPIVDFAIAFIILIGMMLYFGYLPTINMLWVPLLILLELMLATGIGLWLSAISVEYRDVIHVVPFFVQLGLFASPVTYSSTLIPERFKIVYGILNPMSGIIESIRWAVLGTQSPRILWIPSTIIIIVLLISGMFYFKRREKIFADVV